MKSGCATQSGPSPIKVGHVFAASCLPSKDIEDRPLPTGRLATVYLFAGPECPIARAYAPEIGRLWQADAERGIAWIMVFSEVDITRELVRNFQRDYTLPVPAVIDSTQEFSCLLGVVTIPSVVVLGCDGAMLYRGRIDNRYKSLGVSYGPPTKRDLTDVVNAIVAGTPMTPTSTEAIGCIMPPCSR